MAELTYRLTVPDEHADEFVAQLGKCYGYRPTIDGKPNPQTVGDYVAERIRQELMKRVKQQILIAANKIATEATAISVEADFAAKYASVAAG